MKRFRKYRRFSKKRRNYSFGRKTFKRSVRRVVRMDQETKYVFNNQVNVPTSSSINLELLFLNGLTNGSGANQRIGNQISFKSISFNLQCYMNQIAVANTSYVRVSVIRPRYGISTTDVQTYLTATNPGPHLAFDPTFVIVLYDRKALLSKLNNTNGQASYNFKWFKNMRYKRNVFDSNGQNDQQPILYISSDGAPLTDQVFWNGVVRASFKDA